MNRTRRRGLARLALGAGLATVLAGGVALLWWQGAPPASPPLSTLLPPGSVVTSQGRVELDGRPPQEIAATAYLPAYPEGPANLRRAVLAGYDRWRRRWRLLMLLPLAQIPASLQAGPLLGGRDAVVFPEYATNGTVRYRVVGLRRGRPVVLHVGQSRGTVEVVGGVIAERDPAGARGLRWDGRRFRPVPPPPPVPPALVWRYWTDRDGVPHGEADLVVLVPGQRLVPVRQGGGPTVVPIPDANLHVLDGAFRAHRPGTYSVIIPDFLNRPGGSFRLTVEVINVHP
ncbi:MAG: hypothetical protein QN152_06545 [Armatimonadota bacterium]|nr:hypothetical protein [Armatimonadota bacterium]MDR7426131.1 hypothetical protein [Armatimonadota bacterium]MDR7463513.1 hypothetical protein [Armatimonadota bacterium]MDR7469130.1 hypothetical protein [Armatimonadota bacterium]MDR7475342.1 hypothetical protein [Armatimonadota bacterium]